MNEVLNAILTRRSVRKFKQELIPREQLEEIIAAGLSAASGRSSATPIIVAVTNRELRDRISDMNRRIMDKPEGEDPFYGAPELLIVLAPTERTTRVEDGSLVMANLMLAARSLGIGSCWIHRARQEFESEEGKEILRSLGVPEGYAGIGHCILGYPAEADAFKEKTVKPGRVFYAE